MVLAALVTACRLAICPTRRSPLSVKPTTVGVVRPPSLFGTICTAPPSSTATQQFVVPKSIPIVLPIDLLARCNLHQRRANKLVAETVAGNYLLHHCVGFVIVGGFGRHRFVNVRIERFANGRNRLPAERIEH